MVARQIVIIGRGHVAFHLGQLFHEKGFSVIHISSRKSDSSEKEFTLDQLPARADMYLISVKDSAYEEVISNMPDHLEGIIAHTSGALPLSILSKFKQKAVFYPFQTFRKDVPLWEKTFAIFVESDDVNVAQQVALIGHELTGNVAIVDETSRKKIHIAGVFASNFVNYLLHLSNDLLKNTPIDRRKAILPLVFQTVKRLELDDPLLFQTGPAVRNDKIVLFEHFRMLENTPELKEIYVFLTNQILAAYGYKKL